MTPSALLQAACDLLDRDSDATAGRWPRAAAILARQALEVAVDELCRTVHDDLGDCRSSRAQLLCLERAVDPDLARETAHTWQALSRACHVHAYELPPTAEELLGWIAGVDRLVEEVGEPAPPQNGRAEE